MSQSIDLTQVDQNAYRATLVDGLLDLSLGVYLLLVSGGLQTGSVGIPAILGFLFGTVLLKRLKDKMTHPRIGFVEFPKEEPKRLLAGMLAVALLAVLVVAIVMAISGDIRDPDRWYHWTPLFFGLVLLAPVLPMAVRSGLSRYYLLAAVSLCSGVALSLLGGEGKFEGLPLHLLVVGAVATVMGAVTLALFLRRHPLPSEEIPDVGK